MSKYMVYVDDNFHYHDEDERYFLGSFDDAESAIAACMNIVDEFIDAHYEPGVEWQDVYSSYTGFGEDPFIKTDDQSCKFSAWDYARRRCQEKYG
ncbi:MAG: hypothetical protein Q7O66_09215 [Dehalococcoidia bacterium]|nr:hypothetical protein [Dehalococcoidia bacterium]